jgi:hypothetical protein
MLPGAKAPNCFFAGVYGAAESRALIQDSSTMGFFSKI